MSNRPEQLIPLLAVLILMFSCAANSKTPAWVKSEPADPAFYSTVVHVLKTDPTYKEKAFAAAVKNISMQISVNVDASVSTRETEAFGLTASDFNSSIQTSSRAQLSGVEQAGTHETKKEYWAWFRLNKQAYIENRLRQSSSAARIAADLMEKFDDSVSQPRLDFNLSSSLIVKALDGLSDYIDMELRYPYRGKDVFIYTELVQRLGELARGISIRNDPSLLKAVARRRTDLRSKVSCLYGSQPQIPCVSLPLSYRFGRGAGDLVSNQITDQQGEASLVISRVTAYDNQQSVSVELDKSALIAMSTHPLVKKMLNGLNFSSSIVDLEVRRPRVAVLYSFNGTGSGNAVLIKDRLRELDVDVIEDAVASDYTLNVELSSTPGSYIPSFKQYSAHSSASLSLIDTLSRQTLASESLLSVKGTGPNPDQAEKNSEQFCLRALNQDLLYQIVYTHITGD